MENKTCPKCNTIFKFPSFLKIHITNSVRCKLNDSLIYFNYEINLQFYFIYNLQVLIFINL